MPVKISTNIPRPVPSAVRIWVNSELEEIEQALKARSACWPRAGGCRSCFHSLEDRIVKRFMREQSRGPQVPAGIPMTEAQLKNWAAVSCEQAS